MHYRLATKTTFPVFRHHIDTVHIQSSYHTPCIPLTPTGIRLKRLIRLNTIHKQRQVQLRVQVRVRVLAINNTTDTTRHYPTSYYTSTSTSTGVLHKHYSTLGSHLYSTQETSPFPPPPPFLLHHLFVNVVDKQLLAYSITSRHHFLLQTTTRSIQQQQQQQPPRLLLFLAPVTAVLWRTLMS